MNKIIIKKGILSGLAAGAYIGAVALFMSSAGKMFGPAPQILGLMLFLMLFVFSAAVMFVLLLLKPILLVLEGNRADALRLLAWSLGTLFAVAVVIVIALMVI